MPLPSLILALAPLTWSCLAVVFILLTPLAVRLCIAIRHRVRTPRDWRDHVLTRYHNAGAFAWMFTWFKLRLDPMFVELPDFLKPAEPIKSVLDLGCGFGITGSWILERYPTSRVHGIDPNPARVRASVAAFADRGAASVGAAPDFDSPAVPTQVDLVLLLDMIHFIPDDAFVLTLARVHQRLNPNGHLIIRAIIPPQGNPSFFWKAQALTAGKLWHRPVDWINTTLHDAGFKVIHSKTSGGNPELHWFVSVLDSPPTES